jgi:hypothetical protein
MPDHNTDRFALKNTPSSRPERLGGYLVKAGLIAPSQIDVALNAPKRTGMRFEEVLAARGWVKQTIDNYGFSTSPLTIPRPIVTSESVQVGRVK